MKKFLAKFLLTKWLFPYHCHKCGNPLKKLNMSDLPPDIQKLHIEAGTAADINAYAYQCPGRCEGPNAAKLII